MNKRNDLCRASAQISRKSNRGRGSIRISAQQRFIDTKRQLRKVKHIPRPHKKGTAEIVISKDLQQWIDHYKTRDKMVRVKIGYDEFKNLQKGDFHVECLQKDVFIKKWMRISNQMYTKHISKIIGDNDSKQRIKAIAIIGFGRSESFVDVYSDYIESSVPISEKCFDFIGFKQLMKEHAPANVNDFDIKTAWFGMTEGANHEIITKRQWRRYKQTHSANDPNGGIDKDRFSTDEDEKENLEKMNFTKFKKLYYKNVTGKNTKNLFELRKYWRENLNEDQTGTISGDQWHKFLKTELSKKQMVKVEKKKDEYPILDEERQYKFDIYFDSNRYLPHNKPRNDSSWIRYTKNQNVEAQTVRQIQSTLGDRVFPVTTAKYRESIQAFHERESKYKALQSHWEQPETSAESFEMYSKNSRQTDDESIFKPRSTHTIERISSITTAKSTTNTKKTNVSSLNLSSVRVSSEKALESEDTPESIASDSFNISLNGMSGDSNVRRRFRPTLEWIPKQEILRKGMNRKRFGNQQMVNNLPTHLRNIYKSTKQTSNGSSKSSGSVRISKSESVTKSDHRNRSGRGKPQRPSVFHQFNLKPFPLPCLVPQNPSINHEHANQSVEALSKQRFITRERPRDFIASTSVSSSSTSWM